MNCKGRTRCFSDLLTVTQGYFCAGRSFLFSCLFVCLFVCLFLYLNFYFPELPNTLLLPSSYIPNSIYKEICGIRKGELLMANLN